MTNSTVNTVYKHDPVLVDEVIEFLNFSGGKKRIVDCTLGLGGHASKILEKLSSQGELIGFDADNDHLKQAKKNLKPFKGRVTYINANFGELEKQLKKNGVRKIDGILMDLGIASPHIEIGERGFSFMRSGPLDMRFNVKKGKTAADLLNGATEEDLVRIFKEYGEEPFAEKMAEMICKYRKRKKFETTGQLADYIEKNFKRRGKIHPATRIFQALRIEVNKELEMLKTALEDAVKFLKPGGRIVVISYHSLEDRIVKNFFREKSRKEEPELKVLTKKVVMPNIKEIKSNPRSRSAKLRAAEKI